MRPRAAKCRWSQRTCWPPARPGPVASFAGSWPAAGRSSGRFRRGRHGRRSRGSPSLAPLPGSTWGLLEVPAAAPSLSSSEPARSPCPAPSAPP
eukprot:753476-Hanusia_phi.AAC.3